MAKVELKSFKVSAIPGENPSVLQVTIEPVPSPGTYYIHVLFGDGQDFGPGIKIQQ